MISRADVLHVALLSRLALSEEEVERFPAELSAILGHFEQIQGVDVEGVEPMSHPLALTNVLRRDVIQPSLSVEEVLANAPEREGDGFKVPPVIDQGG